MVYDTGKQSWKVVYGSMETNSERERESSLYHQSKKLNNLEDENMNKLHLSKKKYDEKILIYQFYIIPFIILKPY